MPHYINNFRYYSVPTEEHEQPSGPVSTGQCSFYAPTYTSYKGEKSPISLPKSGANRSTSNNHNAHVRGNANGYGSSHTYF